jgi:dynein heavy chain
MAGQLKRTEVNVSEDVLLIRAMRDANIPKFLAEDIPLFDALVQDLFPGLHIEDAQFDELETQITESIEELKFQQNKAFNSKVVQFFDTLNVRFGVMLVGPTGGGKTVCYEVLKNVMTKMERKRPGDKRFG